MFFLPVRTHDANDYEPCHCHLFFCHDVHRHVKKNGKMYAPLLDPIIEEIEQDNECFTLASPFSKLSGKKCFGKK